MAQKLSTDCFRVHTSGFAADKCLIDPKLLYISLESDLSISDIDKLYLMEIDPDLFCPRTYSTMEL